MDPLVMHRTLIDAGFPERQADAIVKVLQAGVTTKEHLDHLELRLNGRLDRVEGRIERLENKANLILGVAVLAVPAPAVTRLIAGP